MTNDSLLKLSFVVPEKTVESVADLMGVVSGCGVEIKPMADSLSRITAFFPLLEDKSVEQGLMELENLLAVYGEDMVEVKKEIMPGQDWATSWQQYFKPFEIVAGLVIKPSWEDYKVKGDEGVIVMDPGQAFGTGQHETSRLVLELMAELFARKNMDKVLDVGTGTGILAMAAALWGAEQVVAIDNDQVAVEVARQNVANNNLSASITVSGDDIAGVGGEFSLIVANIVHDVLLAMQDDFKRLVSDSGYLVLSGLLAGGQEESITKALQVCGFSLEAEKQDGEWLGLCFRKG